MLQGRARLFSVSGLLALTVVAGCGKRGDPQPPLPKSPQPVTSLRLAQRGAKLEVSFETPRLTTAGARLAVMEVELLQATTEGEFEKTATKSRRKVTPGERITELNPLPPPGTHVRVAVRAWFAGERSAPGPVASLKVQPVLPAPEGFTATLEKEGVVLRWNPPPAVRPTGPAAIASPSPGSVASPPPSPPPAPGIWLYRREAKAEYGAPLSKEPLAGPSFRDETAAAGKNWCYVARTVASREPVVESASSSEACLDVKDVFAPEPPSGVSALATAPGAVEVAFSPSPDGDLEHYRVFRSVGGGPFVRVGELSASERTFIDRDVSSGQSYVYQITALDKQGNESAPSKGAECRLP
jgi:hypothetical protein